MMPIILTPLALIVTLTGLMVPFMPVLRVPRLLLVLPVLLLLLLLLLVSLLLFAGPPLCLLRPLEAAIDKVLTIEDGLLLAGLAPEKASFFLA